MSLGVTGFHTKVVDSGIFSADHKKGLKSRQGVKIARFFPDFDEAFRNNILSNGRVFNHSVYEVEQLVHKPVVQGGIGLGFSPGKSEHQFLICELHACREFNDRQVRLFTAN